MNKQPTLPAAFELAKGLHFEPKMLPKRRSSSRNAWMVTFADLMALMLAFFVLLFSMSQLQRQKWQSLVESLASHQSATYETETAKFAADYQVAAPIAPPGADLDYLEPVLHEHFAAEPMLAGGSIERVEGGLGISFPDERLFVGSTPRLTARGTKVLFALGSVLRNLNNAVDVNAHLNSGTKAATANWETALARSVAVARILAQSGFSGPVVARGRGSHVVGTEGLDLLVREDRRG